MNFSLISIWLLVLGTPVFVWGERFTDHGNGTVTDGRSGLIWLKDSGALGKGNWLEARAVCQSLSAAGHDQLTDGSKPGDWRLPSVYELLTLTNAGFGGGEVGTDHPFSFPERLRNLSFWTDTSGFYDSSNAWRVDFKRGGRAVLSEKISDSRIWAVRGTYESSPVHSGQVPELRYGFDRLSSKEKERAEFTALWDIAGLRLTDKFTVMQTDEFLVPSGALEETFAGEDYQIAEVAPTLKFRVLPNLDPEFFPEGEAYQAGWSNWAKITRSPDNRFFMVAGDHRGRGAKINLYEYDPSRGENGILRRVLDISEALGWHDEMYTDGKVHGYMGLMPDGTLWAATHRGPEPTDEWYEDGYRGAWLFSYNIHTGEAINHGNPMVGQELPSHVLDPERGIFLATGHLSTSILSWDVNKKKARYAGSPPNGWVWHARSMFLDPQTGYFWGVDRSEKPFRFLSFDPELNRFKRHDVEVPAHPESGRTAANRLHTTPKLPDGWHLNVLGSTLIRFRPDWEGGPRVEVLGSTLGDTIQTTLCPEQRYLYWIPRRKDTFLVMQYDVKTGQKKAIGFLKKPILREYGLHSGNGVYGLSISECGSFLVALDNSGFGKTFGGHPAVFVIEIPESERRID